MGLDFRVPIDTNNGSIKLTTGPGREGRPRAHGDVILWNEACGFGIGRAPQPIDRWGGDHRPLVGDHFWQERAVWLGHTRVGIF